MCVFFLSFKRVFVIKRRFYSLVYNIARNLNRKSCFINVMEIRFSSIHVNKPKDAPIHAFDVLKRTCMFVMETGRKIR